MMQKYHIRISGRPIKHACFFHEDDVPAFESAVALACTQWGGKGTLMVPIDNDLKIWPVFESMLAAHPPDRILYYHNNSSLLHDKRHELRTRCETDWHLATREFLDGKHYMHRDSTVHSVRAALPVASDGSVLNVPRLNNSSSNLPLQHALYGNIYEGQEDFYRTHFTLNHVNINFNAPEYWSRQTAHSPFDSILNLTSANLMPLSVQGGGFADEPAFEIVVGGSLSDLAFYWNMRAVREDTDFHPSHRRTLFMPPELISAEQISRIAHVIRSAPVIPGVSSTHDIDFHVSKNDDYESLMAAIEESGAIIKYEGDRLGINYSFDKSGPKDTREADPGRKLLYVVNQYIRTPSQYQQQGGGRSKERLVEFVAGENTIEYSLPDAFPTGAGDIILDVGCSIFDRYLRSDSIAKQIFKGGRFTHYGVSGSFSVSGHSSSLKINLPSPWSSVCEYMNSRGYEVRLSRPGRYGIPIINKVGGLDGLGVLADKSTYELLSLLTVQSTKKISQRLAAELSLDEDAGEDIVRVLGEMQANAEMRKVAKTCSDLNSAISGITRAGVIERLTSLAESSLVKRGVLLDCPQCGLPVWHSIGDLDEKLLCDGCGQEHLLPVAREGGQELVLQYVLNSLMNRVMDQDVYPHMLALNCCAQAYQIEHWTVGMELIKSGTENVETEYDFTFIEKQNLHLGECKLGGTLTDNDIKSAKIANELGAVTFTYASVKGFSDDSKRMIRDLIIDLSGSRLKDNIRVLEGDILFGGKATSPIVPESWMNAADG